MRDTLTCGVDVVSIKQCVVSQFVLMSDHNNYGFVLEVFEGKQTIGHVQ